MSDDFDEANPSRSDDFWLRASESSLDAIWDNSEDDIYGELLETLMPESGEKHEHI
ncbi:MAG TPA: hypothetical protein VN956_07485 [Pyrinomonadaceae bacterium]|nr:hypothetical protein [Pyrinomonadaceae bacterium]